MGRRFGHLSTGAFLVAVIGLSTACGCSSEQNRNDPVVIGESVTIHSVVLSEDRTVLVHCPDGYDRSGARYPVLYLLNGSRHFHHATGVVQFLSVREIIPKMIVVAPVSLDLVRDLSPVGIRGRPTSGGAATFLRFIRDDLIPFVDGTYRTQPYRVLAGHSIGGMFSIYTLLAAPETFNAYIADSPSFWWDNGFLQGRAQTVFEDRNELNKYLFITRGEGEDDRAREAVEGLVSILEEDAPEGLEWEYRVIEREGHGSTSNRGIYSGLRAVYPDWTVPGNTAEQGIEAIDAHYSALSERYGYHIDIPEYVLNNFGYRLLRRNRTDEAIEIFKRNVRTYPSAFNVYDSLGEAYMVNGELGLAIEHYKKSLERNPNNLNAVRMLRGLETRMRRIFESSIPGM